MNLNDFGGEKTLKGGSENSIKILDHEKGLEASTDV